MYNREMDKFLLKLSNKSFFKLILGLGNTCVEDIKKISAVYAAARVDMFDLTPSEEVFDAVYEGIKSQNLNPEDFLYCLSFSFGDDKHGRKAAIDQKKCVKCLKCIKKCPQDAISFDKSEKKVFVKQEKCIGCGKCDFCSAISFSKEDVNVIKKIESLLKSYKIDCIEFHISSNTLDEAKKYIKKVNSIFPQIPISICVSKEKFSDFKLKKLVEKFTNIIDPKKLVIQADGISMSGLKDDYSSSLQAVATAQVLESFDLPIILSGGSNSKTAELARLCNVKINGVSVGSYGRNLIKEEIQNPEFWYNKEVFNCALEKAKVLVNSVKI